MAKTRKEVKQDSPPEDDFGALFQHYLLRRTERLLDQVAADDQLLDEEVRSKALAALEFALESQDAHALAGKLLLAMAPKMERAGFRDEWMVYLKRGTDIHFTLKDQSIRAELLYQLGFLFQLRAQYEDAEKYLLQSIDAFARLEDTKRQITVYFRLAFVYRLQRKYEKAIECIQHGFALTNPDDPICAHGYYLRGLLAYDDGNHAEAITGYQRSLELYRAVGEKRMVALRLGNIGLAFSSWRKFEDAISYYSRSILIFEEVQDVVQSAMMKMNLGNVHLLCNDPDSALVLYESLETIFRNIGDELHLTLLYLNRGIAFRLAKEWQKSEQYLLNAIERWRQLGDIQSLVNTLDELGMLYYEQSNFLQAQTVFTKALESLLQIEKQPGFQNLYDRINRHTELLNKALVS